MDTHHPLFRSLVLPFVLAFLSTALLHRILGPVKGRRWAPAAAPFALVFATIWVLGLRSAPAGMLEKLPWAEAAGAVTGLAMQSVRRGPWVAWIGGTAVLGLILSDLGIPSAAWGAACWFAGSAVVGAAVSEPMESSGAPASLVVASIGLAVVALMGGSALLFELGLVLGFAVAGTALRLWFTARLPFGWSGLIGVTTAWVALAYCTVSMSAIRPAALLLLACAFLSGPILRLASRRRGEGHMHPASQVRSWIRPAATAGIAAIWVILAMALTYFTGSEPSGDAAGNPYYTPRW